MSWLESNINNSDVGLLERGKGAYRPKGSAPAYFFTSGYVSMPKRGWYVPERSGYPIIDIYAYRKPNGPLINAFADTRIPPKGVPGVNLIGYDVRARYYRRKRLTGMWLTLPAVALAVAAIVLAVAAIV